jgi:hypothetical protein
MEVSKQKLCSLLRVEEKAEGVGAVDQSIRASDREGLEAQSATAEGGGAVWAADRGTSAAEVARDGALTGRLGAIVPRFKSIQIGQIYFKRNSNGFE